MKTIQELETEWTSPQDEGIGRAPNTVTPSHPDTPMAAAASFIQRYYNASGLRELQYWQGEFLGYTDGTYANVTRDKLNSQAWPFFETVVGGTALKSKQVNEIIKALESACYLDELTPVPCWLDEPKVAVPDLVICRNSALDLSVGDTYHLSPLLFNTMRLPVEYDPHAPEPAEWLKFLNSVWPNDADSIDTLQEIFGLLLTPVTKFQKIFLLVGPKRSGKGTILRTMRQLLGGDNVAAPTLSSLGDPFGLQCMIGKLAALIGDARLTARGDKMPIIVERLLSISGEDSPNVARKHSKDWTGRLPTRIVMSSNEIPHLADASGAMASRFVILTLRESFIGREDLQLEAKLAPEMPAILMWAIKGRERLLKRGRFVQPASGVASVEQMGELSSTVAKFVRECCIVGPEHHVAKDALYVAWRTWCAANGERPTDSGVFGRDLIAAEPRIASTKRRDATSGKRKPSYVGIAVADAASVASDSMLQEFKRLIGKSPLPPGAVSP